MKLERMFLAIGLVLCGWGLARPAQADAQTDLEDALIWNESTQSRVLDRGLALRRLIEEGYLAAKPDRRVDYTDYRLPQTALRFMGAEVLIVTEEYFDKWVGCCAAPGIGIVLDQTTAALTEVAAFAAENRCTFQDNPYFTDDFDQLAGRDGLSYLQCLDEPVE